MLNDKYKEILNNFCDPWWRRQRLLSRVVSPLTKGLYDPGKINIIREDWDNLLLFDACRADMFEETFDTTRFDSYSRVRSNAENSPEWLRKNIDNKDLSDTIYITANPWVQKIKPTGLFKLVDVFENINQYETDSEINWDKLGTVPASLMNKVAIKINKKHPKKRLIIHYFQPHDPVIGDTDGTIDIDESIEPRTALVTGNISREKIWEGYKRNLEYVFHHATNLLEKIDGNSIITADHGELLGERLWPIPIRGYAHPAGVYHPNLLTVPWAKIEGNKREIIAGDMKDVNFSENKERLKNLGYID
jgi:hypothetical protein